MLRVEASPKPKIAQRNHWEPRLPTLWSNFGWKTCKKIYLICDHIVSTFSCPTEDHQRRTKASRGILMLEKKINITWYDGNIYQPAGIDIVNAVALRRLKDAVGSRVKWVGEGQSIDNWSILNVTRVHRDEFILSFNGYKKRHSKSDPTPALTNTVRYVEDIFNNYLHSFKTAHPISNRIPLKNGGNFRIVTGATS